jgi:hypothetical protein
VIKDGGRQPAINKRKWGNVRALTYYVGMSLDGFIAAPDGSIDTFPVTEDVMEFIAASYPETLPTPVREQLGLTAPGTHFDPW